MAPAQGWHAQIEKCKQLLLLVLLLLLLLWLWLWLLLLVLLLFSCIVTLSRAPTSLIICLFLLIHCLPPEEEIAGSSPASSMLFGSLQCSMQSSIWRVDKRLWFHKKLFTLLDLCVSSLRRGHANLLCIVPILTDDPRRESKVDSEPKGLRDRNSPTCTLSQNGYGVHARP